MTTEKEQRSEAKLDEKIYKYAWGEEWKSGSVKIIQQIKAAIREHDLAEIEASGYKHQNVDWEYGATGNYDDAFKEGCKHGVNSLLKIIHHILKGE